MKLPTPKILVISGKRKTSSARATIKPGVGRIRVNNTPIEIWEPEIAREKMLEPLYMAGDDLQKKVDIKVKVEGGGFMGQAEATRMAIAKALLNWTKSTHLRRLFLQYDRTMVAGDPRRSEPKKFGGPGARARDQKSYR